MKYKEFAPCDALKPYVDCYFIRESHVARTRIDTAFATGCVEVMFNLGSGEWQVPEGNKFVTTPSVELIGQITSPLLLKNIGNHITLGIRFFPHTASLFIEDDISVFNNRISDLQLIFGNGIADLYSKLKENTQTKSRIDAVENFLLNKRTLNDKRISKLTLVGEVIKELKQDDFFDNIGNVAARYGITSRYLQKLFLQHTGVTPKLYSKINRFQNSLQLVKKGEISFTSIAHECGYFDQSHFIKEFKTFTGRTPSDFLPVTSSARIPAPVY